MVKLDDEIMTNLQILIQEELIDVNDPYNFILFQYWRRFDRLGDMALDPIQLTSYTRVDRKIRDLPGREKDIREEERFRKYYAEKGKKY